MFRSKSFDDLMILVRDFSYKNNYKILFSLIFLLPLYWVILGILDSFVKRGDGFGLIVFFYLFPPIAGLITFCITILPVKFYEKFMAIFSSLVLSLGVLGWYEGAASLIDEICLLSILYVFSLIIIYVLYFFLKYFISKLRKDIAFNNNE